MLPHDVGSREHAGGVATEMFNGVGWHIPHFIPCEPQPMAEIRLLVIGLEVIVEQEARLGEDLSGKHHERPNHGKAADRHIDARRIERHAEPSRILESERRQKRTAAPRQTIGFGKDDTPLHHAASWMRLQELDKTFNPKKSDMGVCNGGEIVCPKGKVLNLPGERTIYDLIRDEYAATQSARKERVSPETVACLAGISTENIGTRGVWREVSCVEADGFKDIRLTLTFKNGLAVPIVYFRPRNLAKGMTPLLIVGNGQKTQHEKAVAAALRDGRAVVIADLVGCGEINGFKHRFYRAPENEECIAVLLYSLGRSIVGMQAEEILEIANEMKKWFGVAPELEAHDRTCIAAAHAAFVAPGLVSSVKTVSPPPSWGESVKKGGMVPFANVINGALRHYDWTSLLD